MKYLRLIQLLLAVVSLTAFSTPIFADITSTFDTDADGWDLAPGHDPRSTLTYSATGGNPGGCVVFNDGAQGAYDQFLAPAKFLGDDSAYYNGAFSFQILDDSSVDDTKMPSVTITDAAGDILTQPATTFSSGSFVQFSFPLNLAGGWVYTPAGGVESTPTEAEFQAVLSDVSSIQILGDYHNGVEHTSLDNVTLSTEGTTPTGPVVNVTVSVARTNLGSGVPAQIVFTRTGVDLDISTKLVIRYTLKGTAVNGTDYDLLSGKAKIKPDKSSGAVNIFAIGSLDGSDPKTVKLTVQPSSGGTYTVGSASKAKVKLFR